MQDQDDAGDGAQQSPHTRDAAARVATPQNAVEWVRHADRFLTPVILFAAVYTAAFLLLRFLGLPWNQWVGLLSVVAATTVTIAVREQRRWQVGFPGPPSRAIAQLITGLLAAFIVIGATDAILRLAIASRRDFPATFPWWELAAVFMPAAIHEELLFRGYLFQKLRVSHRRTSILLTSAVFALLHAANVGITPLAMTNLFLGGVLLALAYEWRKNLWMPVGLHFGWNLMSGPVLGYPVSGYAAEGSIFRTTVVGPEILTGGRFGLEGSVSITVAEITAITMLSVLNRGSRLKNDAGRMRPGTTTF